MPYFKLISESNESTVVGEYQSIKDRDSSFQSEQQLEDSFIKQLVDQSYEYKQIHNEKELIENLRIQLGKLNNVVFTNNEWDSILNKYICNNSEGIEEKTNRIQDNYRENFQLDNGKKINLCFIDKDNIHNNSLQVIRQFEATEGKYNNRYDVTLLVNGLPLVHIELKRRDRNIREAFNQIERYQRDSFKEGLRLYEYVQLFIISNGGETKYYSNSTRWRHINNVLDGKKNKDSSSFEFTSYWSDAKNKLIKDLVDFTATFLSKHTLLNILTKYCVFQVDKTLLVMRPYQIAATEAIMNRIQLSNNYNKLGCIESGGYIWHSTGSGKTLTSFKTAKLACKLPFIDKVFFVVDRKDLDYQTMREYDKFEKGAANSTKNTDSLKRQIEKKDGKIVITTIQKMSIFVNKNPSHDIFNKHVVIIFDECHRSQFGEMHTIITKKFKKYHLFGFTGTPIFPINAIGTNIKLKTTEQAFGDQLHNYTLVNAISDHNVLPFKIDYIKTIKIKDKKIEDKVYNIDRDAAYNDPRRIKAIVEYILEKFSDKTYRNKNDSKYKMSVTTNIKDIVKNKNTFKDIKEEKIIKEIEGFNSILACSSIDNAKLFYNEFKLQQAELPEEQQLKIALIYSYGVNQEESNGIIDDENSDDASALNKIDKDFLNDAIQDYNKMFGGLKYDINGDKFQDYYKDVSLRMKNRQLDILIVVNMFLTGFDAPTLNTLWVDKNLKMHGLIQAFSRTNRIFNSVKRFGNIICFRNLSKQTDESIALFADPNAGGIVIIKTFNEYYNGYIDNDGKEQKGYKEIVENFIKEYPIGCDTITDTDIKNYLVSFGNILRLKNILDVFDEFKGNEIFKDIDLQDYKGKYLTLREEWIRRHKQNAELINDDIVFELELLKVNEINIDYILVLIKEYHNSHCNDAEILIKIKKAIDSSPTLRSKKELIEAFIAGLTDIDDIMAEWHAFVETEQVKDLNNLKLKYNLNEDKLNRYFAQCITDGFIKIVGTDIDEMMPPLSRFGSNNHDAKKQEIITDLFLLFEKYYGFIN